MIKKDCLKVKITIITATFSIGESATTSAVTSGATTVSSGELPFLPKSNSNIRPLIQRNCWSIHNSTIPLQVLIPIQSFSTDYKCWTNWWVVRQVTEIRMYWNYKSSVNHVRRKKLLFKHKSIRVAQSAPLKVKLSSSSIKSTLTTWNVGQRKTLFTIHFSATMITRWDCRNNTIQYHRWLHRKPDDNTVR